LNKLKHKTRVKYHLAKNVGTEENIDDYKEQEKEYKKAIRRAKRQHFKNRCSEIKNFKDLSRLNKAMQQHQNNKHLGMVNDSSGNLTETVEEMADTLLNTHFPNNSKTPHNIENTNITYAPQHQWINVDTFKAAASKFKNNKAAGPDGIKPIILKNLPDPIIERICTIFSASIDIGYTPEKLCHSKIILIPKQGKDDYTNPHSFRPISLTSFVFKTLERMVLWRLEDTVFKHKPIHKNQHAFRKGHSTEIPLSKLTNFIEQAFINKEYAVCIFLDIIGAFNNITHKAIIKAMKEAKLPPEIVTWYGNYTQYRSCEIKIGRKTFKRYINDGTSQGGILSPIIFNLAINVLLFIIERAKILGIAFADDTMKGEKGRCLHSIIQKLQVVLNQLTQALDETGMKFSTEKQQL
jgi:hypothetical protein